MVPRCHVQRTVFALCQLVQPRAPSPSSAHMHTHARTHICLPVCLSACLVVTSAANLSTYCARAQALQAHAEQYNTLAEQHASVLADAMNNASLRGAGSVTATVAEGLSWLAAAVAAAAAGSNNVQHAIMPSPGRVITAAAGGGTPPSALQSLLELSAGASSSLQALEEVRGAAEWCDAPGKASHQVHARAARMATTHGHNACAR